MFPLNKFWDKLDEAFGDNPQMLHLYPHVKYPGVDSVSTLA